MAKTAIAIFSDPAGGGDGALGRVFNGLFLALELKEKSEEVALIFQGAGARWPGLLAMPSHPARAFPGCARQACRGVRRLCGCVRRY